MDTMRDRLQKTLRPLLTIPILGFAGLLFSQTPAPSAPWSGQAQCQITVTGPGYSEQETHTWIITGGTPTLQGAIRVYAGSWTETGQGSTTRTQGQQTFSAQWTTNASLSNAPIEMWVRVSDHRLIIKSWHSQLRSHGAAVGTQQLEINGVVQSQSPISFDAYEWGFPAVSAVDTSTNLSGSSSLPTNGSVGPMQPGGSQGRANCTWQFAQSGTAVSPVVQPPVTHVIATAGDGSATVNWSAPAGNPASYQVTALPLGLRLTATGAPLTVSGLTNGTAYTFQVVAASAQGVESAPATSNSVTPTGAPASPVGVLTAPDQVSFGQPILLSGAQSHETGGQLTKYCFYLVGNPANLTPADVSGMDTGGCGTASTRTFRAMPKAGPYVFSLYVYDQSGISSAEVRAALSVQP